MGDFNSDIKREIVICMDHIFSETSPRLSLNHIQSAEKTFDQLLTRMRDKVKSQVKENPTVAERLAMEADLDAFDASVNRINNCLDIIDLIRAGAIKALKLEERANLSNEVDEDDSDLGDESE